MPNYEDCVIYTIRTGDSVYVGSTCNFVRRKCAHKSDLYNEKKKSYNFKLYKTIRENDGEWDMQPHKLFPCKNKMEMNIEEERCRRELNADLNSISCCFDKDNENRNKIKVECECGQEVSLSRLHKHKKGKKHFKILEDKQQNIKED